MVKSDLCGFLHRTAIGSRGFSERYLEDRVKQATQTLGIEPENLIIYNYEVRKLGYARQEILEELIRLKKVSDFDLVFILACTTSTKIIRRSPKRVYERSKTRIY